MKIAVYAFANTAYFFHALIREARHTSEIEWSVILPRGQCRNLFDGLLPQDRVFYLYREFTRAYEQASNPFPFSIPDGADNIFLSLSKDKDGYRHLDKEEQIRRAAAIYSRYKQFLQADRPDYVLFPDLETVDGFILINLCYELGIEPVYYVGTRSLGRSFFTHSPYEELPRYFGYYTAEDLTLADEALALFAKGQLSAARMASALSGNNVIPIEQPGLFRRMLDNAVVYFRYERLYKGEDNFLQKVKTNIKPALYLYRKFRFKMGQACYFDIRRLNDKLPENFVLFALQYTPESSINGLEPYFIEQTRAIDLIRHHLPSGYYVLVKEHPAIAGVRSNSFYETLRHMPGVQLVHPSVPTMPLVEKAKLIASITGTIGLECFFAGRPCMLFGRNFFKHLCGSYESYPDFSRDLRKLLFEFQSPTEDEKRVALARIFNVSNACYLGDPVAQPMAMDEANIRNYLAAVMKHISRISERTRGQVSSRHSASC
ncbi:MAG: hypothetical protein IT389_00490 [Nitrospira sp.]|nr:hypothetical protein [Nitrospira sp.]